MPENLTRQILREHLVDGELDPGQPISLNVDQTLLQDATGTMALMQFEQLGEPRVKVDRAVQYVDHNVVALDFKNPDDHRFLRALTRRYGVHFSRPGNGISHYVHLERFARPGRAKFTDMPMVTGEHGAALVPGALAHIECGLHAEHAAGDHTIYVGKVLGVRVHPGRPLVYHAGAYHPLGPGRKRA